MRNLERELLLRKTAARLVSDEHREGGAAAAVTIGPDDVPDALGRPKFFAEVADRTGVPGVVTASPSPAPAATCCSSRPRQWTGGFALTGQLGDVMKESAQIALSYVQARARAGRGCRRHVMALPPPRPCGAIPKDGPSARITMTTALVSLLSGRPVKEGVGMTGEVTYRDASSRSVV